MAKHTPATPLPWESDTTVSTTKGEPRKMVATGDTCVADRLRPQDADYTVHAANAYPKLVAMLKMHVEYKDTRALAASLLRELGEEQ